MTLQARLRDVKVLFRQPDTLALWAIPYEMRPGQQPGDLLRAHRDFVPPPPGHYGSKNVDLSDWIYLGSPGWFGSISRPDQEVITAWLASLSKDAIPQNPYEWSRLADFRPCSSEERAAVS